MNLDGVGGVAGVAAGEGDGDGDGTRAGGVEDDAVAFLLAFQRQGQTAELVLAVGVGAGEVVDQTRLRGAAHALFLPEAVKGAVEGFAEQAKVVGVAGEVEQADVKVRERFGVGVVVLLMH